MANSSQKHSSKSSTKSSKSSTKGSKRATKSSKSSTSSHDSGSRGSYKSTGSYETHSTAPTSVSSHSRVPAKTAEAKPSRQEDISPVTSCYPRSSTETYDSSSSSEVDPDRDVGIDYYDDCQEIPPLPIYRSEYVDHNVLTSTPKDFAKLFPSMNRLSIRHDGLTPDGNMNLRIDTVTPGRRRMNMQLFHLRMYDLSRREFSLRRYCRDSGREVCNSKRKYVERHSARRPGVQRSMSSAFRSLGSGPQSNRTNSGGSLFSSKGSRSEKRPGSSHSTSDGDDELNGQHDHAPSSDHQQKTRLVPSNTIKLEFSNYARVDVTRHGSKGSKRYEFEWWGHRYAWKRVVGKHLHLVSFHLMRDGSSTPVAHVVPEARSPNQVAADENAGGWVPPYYMWICDEGTINLTTDVSDVVIATGLMALVDDCIKERWQTKKVHRIPVPLTSKTVDMEYVGPKVFARRIFQRKVSSGKHPSRHGKPVSAC